MYLWILFLLRNGHMWQCWGLVYSLQARVAGMQQGGSLSWWTHTLHQGPWGCSQLVTSSLGPSSTMDSTALQARVLWMQYDSKKPTKTKVYFVRRVSIYNLILLCLNTLTSDAKKGLQCFNELIDVHLITTALLILLQPPNNVTP